MNKLYTEPSSGIADTPEDELIPAKIIIQTVLSETVTHDPQGGTTRIRQCSYVFGKNGCPDEQHLAKLVASEKIKPYNNSFYQLAMKQQFGPKFGIRQKKEETPVEENDLHYHDVSLHENCTLF